MKLRWFRTWRTVWYGEKRAGAKQHKSKEPVDTLQIQDDDGTWEDVPLYDSKLPYENSKIGALEDE